MLCGSLFGVGRSGVAQTYEAYGVSYAVTPDRFREIRDIVERAWSEASFSHEGSLEAGRPSRQRSSLRVGADLSC